MKYKIRKRNVADLMGTANIFLIPTLMYSLLKICGATFHHELLWYIVIPSMCLLWFIINFKIIKK